MDTQEKELVTAELREKYPNIPQREIDKFLYLCERKGLSPLSKEIYLDKRWSKKGGDQYIPITQIDGFRLVAKRDGKAGQDAPVFEHDESTGDLVSCSITLYRWGGGSYQGPGTLMESYTATAYLSEYHPNHEEKWKNGLWDKMPHVMLAKVVEALASRLGFTGLAGLYVREEMDQGKGDDAPPAPAETKSKARPAAPKAEAPAATDKPAGVAREVKAEIAKHLRRLGATSPIQMQHAISVLTDGPPDSMTETSAATLLEALEACGDTETLALMLSAKEAQKA